jgi:hypothetical protein
MDYEIIIHCHRPQSIQDFHHPIFGGTDYLTQLTMPHVISIRQTISLPPASFRFHLTMNTLALGCGRVNVHLSTLGVALCWPVSLRFL